MAQSRKQSRKQKVLQQVERQRRQRTIVTFTIVAVLIAIIVAAILFLPRPPPNPVQLPSYLDRCVTGSLANGYHSHPDLAITISGVVRTLPVTFGTGYDGSCARVIHTHTSDGVLHVETDQNVNYILGDWFLIWGHWASSLTTSILNSTQIFSYKAGPGTGHTLSMTVNGSVDNNPSDFKDGNPANFQDLWLPRDAVTGQDGCTPAPSTGCVPFNIAITYS